jgi:Archaeal/vacuolar-type H+-ATPase subunit A
MSILQKEAEIKDVVQLVGYDALPEDDKITLYTAQSIREDFLQQSAFDEVDTYTTIKKQGLMLRMIISLDDAYRFALSHGTSAEELRKSPIKQRISRMKFVKEDEIEGFCSETAAEIAAIGKKRT